jgi:hypothetical protein
LIATASTFPRALPSERLPGRIFAALCERYPNRYVALVEQPEMPAWPPPLKAQARSLI